MPNSLDMPTSWSEWASLVSIVVAICGAFFSIAGLVLRRYHHELITKIDSALAVSSDHTKWQVYMKDNYLPQTYARRDLVEAQLEGLAKGQARCEETMKEVKTDVRETVHTLRNDLLALFKPSFRAQE
jgi:hypothetical protein